MPRCRLIRVDPEVLLALADRIVARAELDGVALEPLDLFDECLARVATADKIDLAVELERRILAADARMVGLEASDDADSTSAAAIASTTGVRISGCDTSAYLGARALVEDDPGTTTGFGFEVLIDVERDGACRCSSTSPCQAHDRVRHMTAEDSCEWST